MWDIQLSYISIRHNSLFTSLLTKIKHSIRPDRRFNSPWVLAISADSTGCLKWIWNHYLPSNLNLSLQRSCQSLLPRVLPSFKLKKAGYEPVYQRINNTRKHISQKEPIEIRKNLQSGVDWANIEQDTAIYKLENYKEMYGLGDTPSGRLYKRYFLVNFGVFEWLYSVHCISFNIGLTRVVQMLDSAIHPINHYPPDKYWGSHLRYPLDRDLSNGQHYPSLEQLGPNINTKLENVADFNVLFLTMQASCCLRNSYPAPLGLNLIPEENSMSKMFQGGVGKGEAREAWIMTIHQLSILYVTYSAP